MKTVILALLVVLVISQSEALRCNCGGIKSCSSPVETCFGPYNACISSIIYAGSNVNYFKGCSKLSDCMALNHPGISSASCCMTDLCNR